MEHNWFARAFTMLLCASKSSPSCILMVKNLLQRNNLFPIVYPQDNLLAIIVIIHFQFVQANVFSKLSSHGTFKAICVQSSMCAYLCKNLSIAKLSTPYFSLYAWSSFSPSTILFFMKELCAILSLLFTSNFLHKIKQVGGWGGGRGGFGQLGWWKLLQAHRWATFHTIQFVGQFYWATGRNTLNVMLIIKFVLLGINVTLRNWLIRL
jgi:hypothetical protein